MSAAAGRWKDESVRGDKIKWHSTVDEANDPLSVPIRQMKSILTKLQDRMKPKNNFFTKAAQVAHYAANGARYTQHSDVSPLVPTRRLTFILYLRETPKSSEPGGKLRLTTCTGTSVDIEPRMNRLVVFRSELIHQVLPTYFDRYAITLWAHNHQMFETRDYLKAATIPTIFVSVASYRDPDTNNTIVNLLESAAYPERVTVGVLYQDALEEPWKHSEIPGKYHNRIKSIMWPNEAAKGPVVARAAIQELLFKDEDYYMQIDSHMRFARNWDEALLNNITKCPVPQKSVLSTYPPPITDSTLIPVSGPILLRPTHFDDDGMLRIKGVTIDAPVPSQAPLSHMFVAAGFLFAPSQIIRDCPYDKSLECLFFGEEIILSLRLWTIGWNIYSPWSSNGYGTVCWHKWDRSYRRTFWQDFGKSDSHLESRAKSQQQILDWQTSSQTLVDGYGNTDDRSLSSFAKAAGVDFQLRRVELLTSLADARTNIDTPR